MTYLMNQIQNLIAVSKKSSDYEPYYEVLEYIKLDGTQYFDTGYYGNTVKNSVDFRISVDDFSENRAICGSRNDTSATASSMTILFLKGPVQTSSETHQNSLRLDWVSGDGTIFTSSLTLGAEDTITCTSNKATVNGTTYTSTGTRDYNQNNPFLIGSIYSGTGVLFANNLIGKIYIFKILEQGVVVRDYIPVLDNKMQPCLYDKVTKTFLYAKKISDGTTTYDLGFKRWNKYNVDYIESSGTQYINTGYKFTNTSAFELVCAKTGAFNDSSVFCGARNGTDTTTNARVLDYSYSAPSTLRGEFILLQRGGYDVQNNVLYIPYDTDFHTYYESPTRMSIDDTDRPTVPDLVSPDLTFYIFWQNVGTATAPNKSSIKVKSCKLWDNGTLVRDYKPSVRTYNDGTSVVTKAFLYDEVYNKAYDNAGTGSFKAYIAPDREVYNLSMHDTMDTDGFYLAEDGTKTVSSDGTSCYTEAILVKEGDIIEWTVTAEAVTANKRIHGYSTNADITTGQKGSWVEMLAKIVFSTTSETTQKASFVVPSGVNYIRLSHANTRETKDSIVRIRTYEVGKAIKYPQNNGFTLDAPNSSNFILDLLTRATTTGSYYILDTRIQTGSSSSEDEFGIGGSSSGATVNWKCESESQLVATNGTNWQRNSNYTYSQLLVGYKEGNTFKRTASFYDFNNQKISDVTVVTATRDIARNTKPLTVLHTTSSNWLQNGADIHYFKYLQDDNDVWYDCIPVRNATVTSSLMLFDRANNTSLPNTGSGTPTFVALD